MFFKLLPADALKLFTLKTAQSDSIVTNHLGRTQYDAGIKPLPIDSLFSVPLIVWLIMLTVISTLITYLLLRWANKPSSADNGTE